MSPNLAKLIQKRKRIHTAKAKYRIAHYSQRIAANKERIAAMLQEIAAHRGYDEKAYTHSLRYGTAKPISKPISKTTKHTK